jgi:hypothetical protein
LLLFGVPSNVEMSLPIETDLVEPGFLPLFLVRSAPSIPASRFSIESIGALAKGSQIF